MSSPLPPPPTKTDLAWFMANQDTLLAYLQFVYALQNAQVIVIRNGIRQPPIALKFSGPAAVFEIPITV